MEMIVVIQNSLLSAFYKRPGPFTTDLLSSKHDMTLMASKYALIKPFERKTPSESSSVSLNTHILQDFRFLKFHFIQG
jgi:hypothetical protein